MVVKYIPLLLLTAILSTALHSCTVVQDKEKNGNQAAVLKNEDKIHFDIKEKITRSGIKVENITIDTLSLFHESEGIKISFDVEMLKNAFDSLKLNGYSSAYIQLSCITDNGTSYSSMIEMNKSKRIHINKDRVISFPDTRNIAYQFPYRALEMKEGPHHVLVAIDFFPINFKKDTSSPFFSFIDKINQKPIASYTIDVKVSAPKLYQAIVEIAEFKINTKIVNPQKFDFSMGGSGYPDLYWDLYCGEDFIFYSPQEKNTVLYKSKYRTRPFYCSSEDLIKITFADYDNGPFNTEDDIIDTWSGKITDFKNGIKDTISFGKIEYAVIEAKILK